MAESVLQPSEMFKTIKTVDIPQLIRKPADRFISMPAAKYVDFVLKAIDKTKLPPAFTNYLEALTEYAQTGRKPERVDTLYKVGKDHIDMNVVKSYFGEVLGPIHLLKTGDYDEVVFPVRSNYELFDYFLGKKGKYTGFSAKVAGGTSNTLAPALINERVERLLQKSKVPPQAKIAAEVMMKLAKMGMFAGIATSVGILVKANMLPPTMSRNVLTALKRINFASDAGVLEGSKTSVLSKMRLSSPSSYKTFMDEYVLPRLRLSDKEKTDHIKGKKEYTATNIVYGLGMLLVDANKADKFDVSPLIQTTFQDLNVLKMGLDTTGKPTFALKNMGKSHDRYYFRSKHRWDVVKDKLGVQL